MTDLTQDWKDGKGIFHHRNSGYVYVKDTLENEVIKSLAALYQAPFSLRESKISKGYKILGEVPDYILWQDMCNINNMEYEANNKLRADVKRLEKENLKLRKECQEREKLNYEAKAIIQRQREEINKLKEQRDACAWALDKIADVLVKHKLVKKNL